MKSALLRAAAIAAVVTFGTTPFTQADPASHPAAAAVQPGGDQGGDAMVQVTKGSLKIRMLNEGVLEPVGASEIRIKPKAYNGDLTIQSIAANGAKVSAGDVLLQLDEQPINKDIAAAKNEVETTTAALTKAQSDSDLQAKADAVALTVAQDDVKVAQDNLKWFDTVDGPHALQQSDLQVKQAQYSLDDQNDELDQLHKMYKTEDLTNATSDIVIKRAERQIDLSKLAVQSAKDDQRKVKESSIPESRRRLAFAVDQQTNALAMLTATQAQSAVQRKVALATAQANKDEADKKLADLQSDAKQFKQTAAFDGVVYYGQFTARAWANNDPKSYQPGEKVQAGAVDLTLLAPGKLRVAMDLPESWFPAAKPGLKATVIPVATGELVTGTTIAPSPIPKANGLELLIALPDMNPMFMPGMKATIDIDAGSADNILLVPNTAIADGKVWIKGPNGEPTPKHVITGLNDDTQTQVVSGVAEGDSIYEQAQK